MSEKHCIDLLTGYALEILDGEDRLTAEEHLQLCSECREEMEHQRETLHFCLGQAVPLAQPSALVRTQFLAQFALEVGSQQPARDPRPVAPPPPPVSDLHLPLSPPPAAPIPFRQRLGWLIGGASLPAVAAVVFCVLFLHSQSQLNDQKDNALAAAIAGPHTTMHLSGVAVNAGMHGEVLMQAHGASGVLIVSGIHRVPSGMVYTCWLRKHGQWTDSGALQPDASGIAMVPFIGAKSLRGADGVAITMEHSAQASIPSAPMLLSSPI